MAFSSPVALPSEDFPLVPPLLSSVESARTCEEASAPAVLSSSTSLRLSPDPRANEDRPVPVRHPAMPVWQAFPPTALVLVPVGEPASPLLVEGEVQVHLPEQTLSIAFLPQPDPHIADKLVPLSRHAAMRFVTFPRLPRPFQMISVGEQEPPLPLAHVLAPSSLVARPIHVLVLALFVPQEGANRSREDIPRNIHPPPLARAVLPHAFDHVSVGQFATSLSPQSSLLKRPRVQRSCRLHPVAPCPGRLELRPHELRGTLELVPVGEAKLLYPLPLCSSQDLLWPQLLHRKPSCAPRAPRAPGRCRHGESAKSNTLPRRAW
eukprot:39896-Hanusia_phi.AAC.1